MNLKIKKSDIIPICSFFFYFLGYLLILLKNSMGTTEAQLRYFFIGIAIVMCIVCLIIKNGLKFWKRTKYNDLLWVLLIAVLFYIASFFMAMTHNSTMQFRTYVQIFLVIGPILYGYCLLNLLNSQIIIKCLKALFIISAGLYFTESGHTIIDFFDLSKYNNIFSSHFFTESSLFAELFLQLFLLFNYFCFIKRTAEYNVSKVYVIISAIFVLLCGKRLGMIMVLITPIINWLLLKNKTKSINNKKLIIVVVLFCIGTVLYSNMLQHKIFPEFDIYKFSTGRDYILSLWEKHNFISYGYGTSLNLIGRYLELDLVEIYMELDLVCLIVFVTYYLRIAKKTNYGFIMMIYSLLNMLTASSLPYSLGWLVIILSLKIIEERENTIDE